MPNPGDPRRGRRGTGNRPVVKADVVPLEAVRVVSRPGWLAPPDGLPAGAVPLWDALVSEAVAQRVTEAMVPTLVTLVQAAWTRDLAWASLRDDGLVINGAVGPVSNPAFRMWKDASAMVLRAADVLGLTPAARLRMGLMQLQGESLMNQLHRDLDDAQ